MGPITTVKVRKESYIHYSHNQAFCVPQHAHFSFDLLDISAFYIVRLQLHNLDAVLLSDLSLLRLTVFVAAKQGC